MALLTPIRYFFESLVEIMEEQNCLRIMFIFLIIFTIVVGSIVNAFEKHAPVLMLHLARYGKIAYSGKDEDSFIKQIKVPKSWFKHFYIYSSILTISVFFVCVIVLVLGYDVPVWFKKILNVACGSNRYASVNAPSTLLAMFLFTLQCWRRCYEDLFISVFAKNSMMDLSHYLLAYIHYTGSAIAIVSEGPKFAYPNYPNILFRWSDVKFLDLIATLLFLWSSWHQHKSTVILANLRKNKKGEVVTQEHKLPHGDWFEYLSCPHMVAEILIYFSLNIILWGNMNWFYVFVWVFCNQSQMALMTHWWYQEKFDDLPKHRKAIIPFIY